MDDENNFDLRVSSFLKFNEEGSAYMEGFPIGNGKLGTMVLGKIAEEKFVINDDSVWSGKNISRTSSSSFSKLDEIRSLLAKGQPLQAQELARMHMCSTPLESDFFIKTANLNVIYDDFVDNPINYDELRNYERILDLRTGEVQVNYNYARNDFRFRAFSSFIDDLMVLRYESDKEEGLNLSAYFDREALSGFSHTLPKNRIAIDYNLNNKGDGIAFTVMAELVLEGDNAELEYGDSMLFVRGARAVNFFIKSCSSYRDRQHHNHCKISLDKILSEYNFSELSDRHKNEHSEKFDRVSFTLGSTEYIESLSTDTRLQRFAQGGADMGIFALYFNFARYLFMASSRPGALPPTACGIWTNELIESCNNVYKTASSLSMLYSLCEKCGFYSHTEPLFEFLNKLKENGKIVSKNLFGSSAKGFVFFDKTNIWGDCSPNGRLPNLSTIGIAKLCIILWERYKYSGDKDWLRVHAYPLFREGALFYLSYLSEDKGGIFSSPTQSGENYYIRYQDKKKVMAKYCISPSGEIQIIKSFFEICLKTSEMLEIDLEQQEIYKYCLRYLPKVKISSSGEIQEWDKDFTKAKRGKASLVHLHGIFPGNNFFEKEKKLYKNAEKTAYSAIKAGIPNDVLESANMISIMARLRDGDMGVEIFKKLIFEQTSKSLMSFTFYKGNYHHQIDANIGASAGILEFILQNHNNCIELLPALPKELHSGQLRGLHCHGELIVDLSWKNRHLVEAKLYAKKAVFVNMVYGKLKKKYSMRQSETIELDENIEIISSYTKKSNKIDVNEVIEKSSNLSNKI